MSALSASRVPIQSLKQRSTGGSMSKASRLAVPVPSSRYVSIIQRPHTGAHVQWSGQPRLARKAYQSVSQAFSQALARAIIPSASGYKVRLEAAQTPLLIPGVGIVITSSSRNTPLLGWPFCPQSPNSPSLARPAFGTDRDRSLTCTSPHNARESHFGLGVEGEPGHSHALDRAKQPMLKAR